MLTMNNGIYYEKLKNHLEIQKVKGKILLGSVRYD